MTVATQTFMVTGAVGCIGAWVLRHLVDRGIRTLATDLSDDRARPGLLLSGDELSSIMWRSLDVTDTKAVEAMVADHGVTHIIHLAGLQVPFCRANPPLGAAVNVTGTVNILEAARKTGVTGLSYASSLAVFGPPDLYPEGPVADSAERIPDLLYGVYKAAGEEAARIYWKDWQISSVGLRPAIVFGVGRDQGVSSDIAKSILAAVAGRPFHIRFGGDVCLHHASDVAEMFIDTALSGHEGAALCNIRNDVISVAGFVGLLKTIIPEAQITFEAKAALPVPSDLDDSGLASILGAVPHMPLEQAIGADVARFADLLDRNLIDLGQLED